jgi:hypothetical protein
MHHLRRSVIAGAVALCAGAAVVATGDAQGPTSPTTLQLRNTPQDSVGFGPRHKPRQGDRVGFGERIAGDETGTSRVICTFIGSKQELCTAVLQLSRGTLDLEGLLPTDRPKDAPVGVVGGTGAYAAARGTAYVTASRGSATLRIVLVP